MNFKNNISIITYAVLIGIFPTALFSQVSEPRAIDEFIKPFAAANHFSGVVLAAKDGKIIYEKAFGLANVEHNVPNKIDTKFGIASINKPMTSIVMVRLIESGKITLNDKLSAFIADFPAGDKITVEMLARHRSGIPHRVMPESDETKRFTPAQFVEVVKKANLAFEPGSEELYSSAGYAVLARVLEIASGKPFDSLLDEYVFSIAGMGDSLDYDSRKIVRNTAESYLLGIEGYTASPRKDYSFLVGAGSVFSTTRDLFDFGQAVIGGTFGNTVKQNLVREGVFRSNGSTNGYRSNMRIDDNQGYGYVIVSNLGSGANDLIINNVRNLLEGKEIAAPIIPAPEIDDSVENKLSDYPGRYKLGGSSFEILVEDNRLFAGPFRLLPIGKDKFYSYWNYAEITFKRGANREVIGLEWLGAGGKTDWTRQ